MLRQEEDITARRDAMQIELDNITARREAMQLSEQEAAAGAGSVRPAVARDDDIQLDV
jgi:hypothetical protein